MFASAAPLHESRVFLGEAFTARYARWRGTGPHALAILISETLLRSCWGSACQKYPSSGPLRPSLLFLMPTFHHKR